MSVPPTLEHYLDELRRGLRLLPGNRADVLDEVRDHLLEALERAQRAGCTPAEAERLALEAFGEPRRLARRFVAQHSRGRARLLFPLALALGLAMAYIDSRPTWDDTGVSAFAVVITTGLLGLLEPSRPWLWTMAIGLWFPSLGILLNGNYGAFLALLVACVGAYGGSFVRRFAAAS